MVGKQQKSSSKLPSNKLNITEKNFINAQKFLDLFEYDKLTFVFKHESEKRIKTLVADSLIEAREEIIQHQNNRYAFFFMVNPGDGIIHEGKKTARSQKSVTALSACFADTDKGDANTLWENTKNTPANIRVLSSPGRYHAYWLLNPVEPTKDNIGKFVAIQRKLMSFDNLFDKSLADSSQLLRVPFFYHQKKAPFLILPEKEKSLEKYDLDDLFERLNCHKQLEREAEPFQLPDKVDPGARHQIQIQYLRHLKSLNPNLTELDLQLSAIGLARMRFSEFKEWMPGGTRFHEVSHNVKSTLSYHEQEQVQQASIELSEIREEKETPAFYLSEETISRCPNELVADMVRYSCSYARYPAPAFEFAAILGMFGMLRSHLFKSKMGAHPSLYQTCLGPTGIGKTHSQNMVSDFLLRLGKSHAFVQALTSEKGIYRGLADGDGILFCMIDEVAGIISNMTNDPNAPAYSKSMKEGILRLYNHTDRRFTSAKTGNEKETPYVIEHPCLNLVGYSTLEMIQTSFNMSSLKDGVLARMNFWTVPNFRKLNDSFDAQKRWTEDHIRLVREEVLRGMCAKETDLLELEDATQELNALRDDRKQKNGKLSGQPPKEELELQERILQLSGSSKKVYKPILVEYTGKAKPLYTDFSREMDDAYNKESENPVSAVYTRAAEKVDRMCVILAGKTDKIDSHLVNYAIEIVRKQISAQFKLFGSDGQNIGGTSDYQARNAEKVLSWIKSRVTPSAPVVTRRDIFRGIRRLGKDAVEKSLSYLEERGDVEALPEKTTENARKTGKRYKLLFEI